MKLNPSEDTLKVCNSKLQKVHNSKWIDKFQKGGEIKKRADYLT